MDSPCGRNSKGLDWKKQMSERCKNVESEAIKAGFEIMNNINWTDNLFYEAPIFFFRPRPPKPARISSVGFGTGFIDRARNESEGEGVSGDPVAASGASGFTGASTGT